MKEHIEKTLIMFKPHGVQRGIVGEILTRFEKVGLKIVGAKMMQPTHDQFFHHYETIGTMVSRHGNKIFEETLSMMNDAPVLAFVLQGVDAVEIVRKMVGPTEPKSALPGTIRGDYAHVSRDHSNANNIGIYNILHASGNKEEAKAELAHWFNENELFDYESVHDIYAQTIKKS